jgi:4-amino-4-deoxy-L-arabinose transferase-like glycosyltransferase
MARRVCLVALLCAAVVPYFIGLGDSAIWDANEAFYVETPREMIESGDYIHPAFNYEPRLNKPVLSYWIVAGFYKIFGVSVGVQRLPIALAAAGLILTALLLASLMQRAPPAQARASEAALWAGLGLAIAPRLLMFARRIFIDIYISLFMGLTLLFFAAAERFPERRRLFLSLMYVSVGLGMLTKGPVAAVVPALVFAAYLLVNRELKRITSLMIPAGVLIVLAIVVPWYATLYWQDGWGPIVSFFVGENVNRFTSGLGVRVERGPLFYLPVVFSDSFPWALFLVPAAAFFWHERRAIRTEPAARVRTLLWLWILVFVGFFSLSAGKQDLYIFPIVPAIAALAGDVVARATRGAAGAADERARREGDGWHGVRRWVSWTLAAAGILVLAAGLCLLYLFKTAGATYAIEGVAAVGAIGVLGGGAATLLALLRRVFAGAAVLAGTMIALSYVFVLSTLPSFEAYKPVPPFAATIAGRATAEDVVATYDQALPSLVFYLRRHVVELFDREGLERLLGTGKTVYAVMSSDDFERIGNGSPAPLCVIERRPTFDVRLSNVLAREPLPELVLVTNDCVR